MKNRLKNIQRAQGMVEFALVLPILLLVILGIFAFGHLFFTYSSVVSASREAARWGSAVGVGSGTTPRYRDCIGIRAAAVRVGSFAGVDGADAPDDPNVNGVYVGFDHGPNDANPDFDTCADDVGPGSVGYGDRVKVRVTVLYRPIVPLVNLPTFHLTATTARTIVKSVPVGEAATAEVSCPTTAIDLSFIPNPVPSGAVPPYTYAIASQQIDVNVRVTSSDGTSPTGSVDVIMPYEEPDGTPKIASCSVNSTSADAGLTCTLVTAGQVTKVQKLQVTTNYTPTNTASHCYVSSQRLDELSIVPADTITTITSDKPDFSFPDDPVLVTVVVKAVLPGSGYPDKLYGYGSSVTVSDQGGSTCKIILVAGTGSCTIYPHETTSIFAIYNGEDPNYKPSTSAAEPHTVMGPATATPPATSTPIGMKTVTPTPTKTATPQTCPKLIGSMDFSITDSLQFEISNPGNQTNIQSIDLVWPSYPETRLREARFGSAAEVGNCSSNKVCLWQAPDPLNGLTPAQKTISSSTPNWSLQAEAIGKGGDMFLRLYFNGALPQGGANTPYYYFVAVHFKNGCVLEVPAQY